MGQFLLRHAREGGHPLLDQGQMADFSASDGKLAHYQGETPCGSSLLGCLVGVILAASVNALAWKDSLGRSPQQQQYDYFRQRQMWIEIG